VADAGPERKLREAPCRRVLQQHNYQLKKGMRMPAPFRVCGVGLLCDYGLYSPCGGNTLKQRLIRRRKKAKVIFDLVLQEMMSAQLEK